MLQNLAGIKPATSWSPVRLKNMDGFQQITLANIDAICPLTIPDLYIQNLVKIYWYLVKIHWYELMLSSRIENMDRPKDGQNVQCETIIPHHYLLAGYKNAVHVLQLKLTCTCGFHRRLPWQRMEHVHIQTLLKSTNILVYFLFFFYSE